jgi:hypothetical protein
VKRLCPRLCQHPMVSWQGASGVRAYTIASRRNGLLSGLFVPIAFISAVPSGGCARARGSTAGHAAVPDARRACVAAGGRFGVRALSCDLVSYISARSILAGPEVRIHLPPAASGMRTRLIHLRAYPPVSRTPATSGPMRSRLWAGSGGTRSRFISIEPQYRWSSTSVVVRALLRTIGGTFRRPGRRSQPPQATAPLWANRGHDGRPRIVEKWKR